MKKLILGIVAVFSIQAGFILLTGTDPTADLAFNSASRQIAAVDTESPRDPTTSAQPEITVVRETIVPPGEIVTAADIHPQPVYNRRAENSSALVAKVSPVVAKADAVHAAQPPPVTSPAKVEFQNEYAAVLVKTSNDFPDYEITTRETGRSEGRSFSEKIMPKLRKPYGWLKSLSSKLK